MIRAVLMILAIIAAFILGIMFNVASLYVGTIDVIGEEDDGWYQFRLRTPNEKKFIDHYNSGKALIFVRGDGKDE